jgi:hypothetical protein
VRHAAITAAALLLSGCVTKPFCALSRDHWVHHWTDDRNLGSVLENYWVESIPVQQLEQRLRPGDHVRVITHERKRYRFEVIRADADGFVGRHSNLRSYRMLYADITELGVVRDKTDGQLAVDFLS